MSVPLTVACGLFDRTLALFHGDVAIEGCDSHFIALSPEEAFYRAFSNAEFDVAELSFSSYLIELSRGEGNYIGLPVFLGRSFRHSSIYVREDRIRHPLDLKGCRIGVPEYQVTAAVWARGILSDDYGVLPQDMSWFCGGVEQPGRRDKVSLQLPDDIQVTALQGEQTLSAMLRDGDIDALIAPRVPSCFTRNDAHVRRLFNNAPKIEADYFSRTGIFPIMHILGLRRTLVSQYPWLPRSVAKAFELARTQAELRLRDTTAPVVMLPWLSAELERTCAVMGENYWPYGVQANRKVLETLLRYESEQGLLAEPLSLDAIFAPGCYDSFRV